MAFIVFMMIRAIPGNPAQVILGQQATKEAVAAMTKELGLDKPWFIQFWDYLSGLLKGDLGVSLKTNSPVSEEIGPYLMATIELALIAMIIAVVIGVNAGIISAWFQNSWFDYVAMVIALIGLSMPIFWLGLMEQYIISIQWDLLPTTGRDNIRDPVAAITGLYLMDTLIAGRVISFLKDQTSHFARNCACDHSDGHHCKDDTFVHAGGYEVGFHPYSPC